MRLLVVDHNALDPLQRSLYEELSRSSDIELRLMVPEKWFDNYRMLQGKEERHSEHFSIHTSPVVFATRTHRMIYRSLRREIGEFKPDILYINAEPENFQTYHAARLLRKHPQIKLVFSSWRNIDHAETGYLYRLEVLHKMCERAVLRRAAAAIVFNTASPAIYAKSGFDTARYIPPYVDTNIFKPVEPGNISHSAPFRILFAGRFIAEKGVDSLFRAASTLTFPYTITLIGSGPAQTDWKNLADNLSITKNVSWVAPVEHGEMPARLHQADAVVLPSRTGSTWKEQFGRILIEAMACGVPVVGSDSGEIPEVIGDAGVIFPEGGDQALTANLTKIHTDGALRTRLIKQGRERVNSNFSLKAVAPQYLSFFQALLRKKAKD